MDLNFITNHVLFEVREGVAYITLNDPEHLNPVTAEVTQDLVQCLIYCEREKKSVPLFSEVPAEILPPAAMSEE